MRVDKDIDCRNNTGNLITNLVYKPTDFIKIIASPGPDLKDETPIEQWKDRYKEHKLVEEMNKSKSWPRPAHPIDAPRSKEAKGEATVLL